ncbi:PR domain zinc finger protein 5-like isoform X2 [Prorops nasuta]|uniref:PR domain zinc finger protein 5-like isoform X2 n=1 Tax=Prorops nasuta TaxID=863751 RepID=UPI0034CF4BF1
MSACSICGQAHKTDDCFFLSRLHYVSDSPVISRARQTIPNNLQIKNMADGTTTVIAKEFIIKGTTFGPLHAKKLCTMNPLANFQLKIFDDKSSNTYHLDLTDEEFCNWMCFVPPATNAVEQNLICYQMNGNIFYSVIRTIPTKEELKVWYAPYYAFKMKIPLYNKYFANSDIELTDSLDNNADKSDPHNLPPCNVSRENIAQEIVQRLSAQHLGAANEKEVWNCKMCSEKLASVVIYAKHLMDHYKPLLGAICNICNKRFNSSSVLERHRKAKHSYLWPSSNNQMADNQPQSSESIGLNATNQIKNSLDQRNSEKSSEENTSVKDISSEISILNASDINVNDLLQTSGCYNINSSESILTVNGVDNVKFNVDELATELLKIVSDVHDQSNNINNLDCDICNKKFDKVDYLYRHLRKHTGEFICTTCLVVFARKENLISHSCFTHRLNPEYECSYCQKTFIQKKYLKRHMVKHIATGKCKWCSHVFMSETDRKLHKCVAPNHECIQCKKKFVHKMHLTRHMKSHTALKVVQKKVKKKQMCKSVICEKCGDLFKNQHSLKQHLRSHGEKLYECDVCHSRFHRIGVLKEHKAIHRNVQVACSICEKKLKSKKALDIHMLLHGNKKYQCDKCDKIHGDKITYSCPHCPIQFTSKSSFDKHVSYHVKPAQYSCSLCPKSFHKEYQLKRHVQASHSGVTYRCPFCQMTARHRHSMKRHFERQHSNLRDQWDKSGFTNQLAEKPSVQVIEKITSRQQCNIVQEPSVDTQKTNSDNLNSIEGQEILLQLPDMEQSTNMETVNLSLSEVPQLNISEPVENLSESVFRSAYMFDEGNGDVMFYILDNTSVNTAYQIL